LIGGVKETVIPGAARLSKRLTEAGKRAGLKKPTFLLPAQYSENQLVDTIQGIGENALMGDALFRFKRGQKQAGRVLASGLADSIAEGASKSSIEDIAALTFDTIEGNNKAFMMAAGKLYGELDEVIGKSPVVNLRGVKEIAEKIAAKAKKAGNIGHTPTSLTLLDRITKEVDNVVDFQAGHDIRSGLLDITRRGQSKLTPDPKAVGIAKQLTAYVDQAMEDAAKNLRSAEALKPGRKFSYNKKAYRVVRELPQDEGGGIIAKTARGADLPLSKQVIKDQIQLGNLIPPRQSGANVVQMWRDAEHFWKTGKETFNNKLVSRLMRDLPDKPEILTKTVFRPGGVAGIKMAKKAVGPREFQKIKGAWLQQLVADAVAVDPSDIAGMSEPLGNRILKKFNGLGPDALNAAFTKTEQQTVRDTGRILAAIQKKTGGHSGALRFVQGSAFAVSAAAPCGPGAASQALKATSGVVLVGPAVLGRLMTKPGFARLLKEGYRAKPGTQQAVVLAGRLLRNVLLARREINTERSKRKRQRLQKKFQARTGSLVPRRGAQGRQF
jgi:hypothetical protein